ncbi:zinc finger CCHC domain-containing protein 7-like [Heracleum sosnowskyi]|uniref:Zinc finger CCHC domain-containing protein 7-like n=1 Tax=Heracleum sosnowskyi TaxID=360622 RepID=A0AAD8GUH4_9APIA|nr:zinc finger CCHC domain-containing protein 7-like [Heracleum sosnowskyi]
MVRIKKFAKIVKFDEEEELYPPIKLSSDDDEEANEDLSLKIVRKAVLRACGKKSESEEAEKVTEVKKKKVKRGKKKSKRIKTQNDSVVVEKEAMVAEKVAMVEEEEALVAEKEAIVTEEEALAADKETMVVENETDKAEECKSVETDNLGEPEDKKHDNVVLRKLLRGPRYFDPPDSSWGTCYNCGEEGHTAVKCKSAKRTKPCFVCGSLEHNVKQCTKGKDCYICKKGGHRAKDCKEKKLAGGPQSSNFCLKCGEFGHEIFSCRNDYLSDDLKDIKCYICKSSGHLCCVNYGGSAAGKVSCYRCGQAGHTGLACTRLRGGSNGTSTPSSCYRCGEGGHFSRECTSSQASTRQRSELYGTGTPSSCYKCGEGGHFARECTSSAKNLKRNRESSTSKVKTWGQDDNQVKGKSLPFDLEMAQVDEGFSASSKAKRKNDWISENSGDYTRINGRNYRNSPLRPTNKIKKFSDLSAGNGYASTPNSRGTARHHRFDYSPSDDTVGDDGYGYSSKPHAYGSAPHHRFDYQHNHLHHVSDYSVSRDSRFYDQMRSASKPGNYSTAAIGLFGFCGLA